jgi:hypothetical protein
MLKFRPDERSHRIRDLILRAIRINDLGVSITPIRIPELRGTRRNVLLWFARFATDRKFGINSEDYHLIWRGDPAVIRKLTLNENTLEVVWFSPTHRPADPRAVHQLELFAWETIAYCYSSVACEPSELPKQTKSISGGTKPPESLE